MLHQKNFLSHYFLEHIFLLIIIKHLFSFYNIFFYTLQVVFFHPLRDICNVHDHIVVFFFFFFRRISISSTSFFWSLSLFLEKLEHAKLIKKDLLEYLKLSLLNCNFVMIYIIQRTLVLFKNNLNHLKGITFKYFLKYFLSLIFFYFFHNI